MRLPYDQHTIVQARQLGNARERSWQPHRLSLSGNSVRAYEPENDKQNHAVCVPQPSCLDALRIIVLPRNKHEVRNRPILGSSLLNRLAPLLESTKPASHDESPTLHMVTPPEIWTRGQETLQATFDIGISEAVTRGWGRDSPKRTNRVRRPDTAPPTRRRFVYKLTTPKVLGRDGAGRGGLSDCVSCNTDSRSIQVVVT